MKGKGKDMSKVELTETQKSMFMQQAVEKFRIIVKMTALVADLF